MIRLHVSASTGAFADAIALLVHETLAAALARRERASLVVCGGSTPASYLPRVAACPLDWARVDVALADERWVSADDSASNERLVRAHLLRAHAAAARLVGLGSAAATPEAGAAGAATRLGEIAHPYDLAVLGMGNDGHVASLFPGSPQLEEALDAASARRCIAITPPPHARPALPRVTMTLAELLKARRIVLAIQGRAKRAALEAALLRREAPLAPVAALIDAAGVLDVHWTE